MSSQVLGLFGDIVNGIGNIFSGIANWFSDRIGQYIDYLISIILKLVYEILKVFFMILDFVQLLFRKIAGLDTVSYNGEAVTGDIAWWLFQQPAVTDALISLTIVAVVMVFMATFIAVIRNHYKAKDAKETAIAPVIGQAFKAIISFAFVPVVCYFGVFVSNGLLKTVDQATRLNDSVSISGEVFSASAMSANRARTNSEFATTLAKTEGLNFGIFLDDNTGTMMGKTAAEKIDRAFASKQTIDEHDLTISDSMSGCDFMFHQFSPGKVSQFDYMNTDLVFVYYDFTEFNWLFAFVSCFFIATTLLYSAMGVIQRLFEITLLFAISPPFIALMPLDGGGAFKSWSKMFIQKTVIMYGIVVALNFFFIIAPLLQNIDLFYTADEIATYGKLTCDLFNSFAHILFIMCGALMIKEMTGLLNGLVTGDSKGPALDAMGGAVLKDAKGAAGSITGKADKAHKFASKRWNDFHSEENIKKRKEAKLAKQEAKDTKSAYKSAAGGLRDAGEVGYWGSRRAIAEQRAEDNGKTTLRSRLFGKNQHLETAQEHLKASATEALKEGGIYAVNKNNASKQSAWKRAKNKATLKSPRRLSANATRYDTGNKYETAEMKKYRAARKEYADYTEVAQAQEYSMRTMFGGETNEEAKAGIEQHKKDLKSDVKFTEKVVKASRKLHSSNRGSKGASSSGKSSGGANSKGSGSSGGGSK